MTDNLIESFIQISSTNSLPALNSTDLVVCSQVSLDKETVELSDDAIKQLASLETFSLNKNSDSFFTIQSKGIGKAGLTGAWLKKAVSQ